MGSKIDASLAILNGVLGDHLVRRDNGLATDMTLVVNGRPVATEAAALARAYPAPSARIVLLVHGLMTSERIWRCADTTDYGGRLAADLGFTPLYLRYNSGRAIADNGAELSELLEALVRAYPVPVEEILLLGYSMGGLVLRSACHAASVARHGWLARVQRAIYVGTPHRGAPLERAGRWVARLLQTIDDPYTRVIAEIANVRSDGLKDLGDAHLRHEDRLAAIAGGVSLRDARHPVPLLPSIRHYLIAGTLLRAPESWLGALFGDALVPLSSATDGACTGATRLAIPPAHVKLMPGLGHLDLPRSDTVYETIRAFCEDDA
jgi:pimeloyl-ACP methyl ester carboxylesterase